MARRNLTDAEFTYYIGKKYETEKKCVGEHEGNQYTNTVTGMESPQNEGNPTETAEKIAEQFKVGRATVERAEQFSKAIDTLEESIGGDNVFLNCTDMCTYKI